MPAAGLADVSLRRAQGHGRGAPAVCSPDCVMAHWLSSREGHLFDGHSGGATRRNTESS